LEVILSTPLRVSDILAGQWLGLRRFFGWPFLTLMVVELLLVAWAFEGHTDSFSDRLEWVAFAGFGAVLLFADCVAIGSLGMWLGIRARTPHRAASSTLIVVLAVPCVILAGLATLAAVLRINFMSGLFWTTSWLLLGLVTDLIVILWARGKYQLNLRRVVSEQFTAKRRAD
jgi:ABC-type Na+ efflux pump permease subunit